MNKEIITRLETALPYWNRFEPKWNLSTFRTKENEFTLDLTNPDTRNEFCEYLIRSQERESLEVYQNTRKTGRPLIRFHCVLKLTMECSQEDRDNMHILFEDWCNTIMKSNEVMVLIWEDKEKKEAYLQCPELVIPIEKLRELVESLSAYSGMKFDMEKEWFPVIKSTTVPWFTETQVDWPDSFLLLTPLISEKASEWDLSLIPPLEPLETLETNDSEEVIFLPEYVTRIFETLEEVNVKTIKKGKISQLWLIKYRTNNGHPICCQNKKYHINLENKDLSGTIIWNSTKGTILFQCLECKKQENTEQKKLKWKLIATVIEQKEETIHFQRPRLFNSETEEDLRMELDLSLIEPLMTTEVIGERGESNDHQVNKRAKISEEKTSNVDMIVKLLEDKWHEKLKVIGRGRTNNIWILHHTKPACLLGGNHEGAWNLSLSWLKENQGNIRIKCLEPDCKQKGWKTLGRAYYNERGEFTFDIFEMEFGDCDNNETTQPPPHDCVARALPGGTCSQDFETVEQFSFQKLDESIKIDVEKAIDYLNIYFVMTRLNGKLYSRWNKKLTWNLFSKEDASTNLMAYQTSKKEPIFNVWLKSKKARKVSHFVFTPKMINKPDVINLFRGFRFPASPSLYVEIQSHMQIWEDHVINIICCGDRKLGNYFIDHLARIVQRPWIKSMIAFIITSEHGAGKGVVFKPFRKLLGKPYFLMVNNLEKVFGNFNAQIDQCIMCVMDEITIKKSSKYSDTIKNLITESETISEDKYIKAESKKNYSNFFFLSNAEIVLDLELTERRHVIFEPLNTYVGTTDPKILNLLTAISKRDPSILRAYLERRVVLTDGHTDKPITKSVIKHKLRSLNDPYDLWIYDLLKEKPMETDPTYLWFESFVLNDTVLEVFKSWCSINNKQANIRGFFQALSERYNIEQSRIRQQNARVRGCLFPSFTDLRKRFVCGRMKLKDVSMVFSNDTIA